ncbi:MAG: hypothetical protein ACTHMS_03255 [Jatrophihabitans sp.]|uniref:hypothetical protein n=1 Tax=Jatrophihabitans sp. TaxID=1932789 RepID=UPI003F81023C
MPPTGVSAEELTAAWRAAHQGQFTIRAQSSPVGRRRADLPAQLPDNLPLGCVAVLGAHHGAGTSSLALALADAAAHLGRPVDLIDTAAPPRSALAGVTTAELGTDPDGAWRRGTRGHVTVYRRTAAGGMSPEGRLALPRSPDTPTEELLPRLTVVDLGTCELDHPAPISTAASVVLVSRCAVPALRSLEHALAALDEGTRGAAAAAVVGPPRWPGLIAASLGPHVRRMRAAGQLVPVPRNHHLDFTGPTSAPLPRRITTAAARLLQHLDHHDPAPERSTHR